MHASLTEKHISGGERIVTEQSIERTVSELLRRAMNKESTPDRVTVTVEDLRAEQPQLLRALDVITFEAFDAETGRALASRILLKNCISSISLEHAIRLLSRGPAPSGENMRGAVIMDSRSGERFEPDRERGVRASRFDWSDKAAEGIRKLLDDAGLSHFRTYEALALATKIAHGPGVVAELCWSDDADYTAGYVASASSGYVRFPALKEQGDNKGGRVVFVQNPSARLEPLIRYLETEPVLINEFGSLTAMTEDAYAELFINQLNRHV